MTSKPPPNEDPQLPLDLSPSARLDGVFLQTPAAATAFAALSRWRNWPEGQMALIGARASGKTRLAAHWAADSGAWLVSSLELATLNIKDIHARAASGLAVDDADASPSGVNLLAAINLCRESGAPLLLTGTVDPALWELEPRDLRSRLGAAPTVHIEPPDDITLDLRLAAACEQRFMKLPPETSRYIVKNMNAGYEAIDAVAEALASAANGKALSRAAARRALEALHSYGGLAS